MSESRTSGRSSCTRRRAEESLAFFVDILGMEVEAQDGRRRTCAAGRLQRWSLKLIASDANGWASLGAARRSPEALERRVAAVEAAGLGEGWTDGDVAAAPPIASATPTGTASSSTTSASATRRRRTCGPR